MIIKSKELIDKIRISGKILKKVLDELSLRAVPGVSLLTLDKHAEELIIENGGKPVFKGYKPYGARVAYPATICASINDVVVHGVPSDYILKDGDILKIDIGVNWKGGISDSAITIPVGGVKNDTEGALIRSTELSLYNGIKAAQAGNTLGDIGYAIEKTVRASNFFIVDGLTGHGVGYELHEDPSVYNTGKPGEGMKLQAGMVLALEPMTSIGSKKIIQLEDDSYATSDGSMSAHFEHTILITDGEAEILTA